MAQPRLWIAYDYTDTSDCLDMLDTIIAEHPDDDIIHEIGRPTILNAALRGVQIVTEFRRRLTNGQTLVADFNGFDVPYSVEGRDYYQAGADMVTVMAAAPDEAIDEAITGARADNKQVAFDLMSYQSNDLKADRAAELAKMGATIVSCHTGWNEQASGKTPLALIDLVCDRLRGAPAQVVAMGGLKPADVRNLEPHIAAGSIFAVVAGSSITRSPSPSETVRQFKQELAGA